MEKLIELLNEYEEKALKRLQRKYYSENGHIMYIDEEGEDVDDYRTDYEIISKDYRFIQWLVDNDKIDRDRILKEDGVFRKKFYDLEFARIEDRLLMLLAISDTPINDLISYLK